MSTTLQERHNLQQTLEQLQTALERSQDQYNTYADLQHQLKMLGSQVGCTCSRRDLCACMDLHVS